MDDLSKITTQDLMAFREGRLSDISTEGLMSMRQMNTFYSNQSQNAGQEKKSGDNRPSVGKTILDQGLQGATFGFADEITDRIGAGIASVVTGEKYSDLLPEARATTKQDLKRQMEERPVLSLTANLAGGVVTGGAGAATKTGGAAVGNLLRSGKTATRIAKGAGAGAVYGGAYGAGTADEGERLEGAIEGAKMGAVVGGAIPGVGAGVSKLKNTIAPKVDDVIRQTAELAQKHNIPLGLDQITGSKSREFITSTSGRVPLSGGKAFAEAQQKAFNNAILKTIGQEGDRITDDLAEKAYNDIGKKFDDVLGGRTLQINENHIQKIMAIIDDAEGAISGDKVKALKKTIGSFIEDLGEDGTISGEKIGDIRSVLTKKIKRADPGVKEYLGDLMDLVIDISTDGNPEARALLREARYQYKNLKTIEPLIAKGASEGNIRPALLKNRVITNWGAKNVATGKAGDLGDLARVGDLIKGKIGDSGTAERLAAYYALTAAPGAAIGAYKTEGDFGAKLGGAALGAAATVGAAKGYQAYNRSPALVKRALRPDSVGKLPPTAGSSGGYLSKGLKKKATQGTSKSSKPERIFTNTKEAFETGKPSSKGFDSSFFYDDTGRFNPIEGYGKLKYEYEIPPEISKNILDLSVPKNKNRLFAEIFEDLGEKEYADQARKGTLDPDIASELFGEENFDKIVKKLGFMGVRNDVQDGQLRLLPEAIEKLKLIKDGK